MIGHNNMYADCIPIKDIKPGLKNINVVFIVLDKDEVATITKQEKREVRNFLVADATARINVSVWDEPGKLLIPGDIVKLTKGYASVWRHCLTLYSGKNGEIHKLGDFCLTFNETVNMSEPKRAELPALQMPIPLNSPPTSVNNGTNNNGNTGVTQTRPPLQPAGGAPVISLAGATTTTLISSPKPTAPSRLLSAASTGGTSTETKSAATSVASVPHLGSKIRTARTNQTRANLKASERR